MSDTTPAATPDVPAVSGPVAPVQTAPAVVGGGVPGWAKYTAKAICSALVVAVAYLISVLQAGQGLGDVSLIQWLTLGYLELGAFGFTYWIPNGPKPGSSAGGPAA